MKKKIECRSLNLEARIIEILKNESDEGGGILIEIETLCDKLKDNFEFSSEELTEVLNNLNFHLKIRLILVSDTEEGSICVEKISLGPGLEKGLKR